LDKFSGGTVTADELASAKEALIRSLPSALETNDAVSGAMANLVSLGCRWITTRHFPAHRGLTLETSSGGDEVDQARPVAGGDRRTGGQSKEALEKLGLVR